MLSGPRRSTALLALTCLTLAALSLYLGRHGPIVVLDDALDTLWYLRMGESILRGEWLGAYDSLTLVRAPVYPMFLALNAWLDLPLHLVQQTLYVLAVLSLAAALHLHRIGPVRIALLSALLLLHPVAIYPARFVATEGLYIPLAVALLATALGTLAALHRSRTAFAAWLGGLSLIAAVFWYVRGEAIWVLPFLAVLGASALWISYKTRRYPIARLLLAVCVPVVTVQTTGYALAAHNERHYGVAVVHEAWDPALLAAYWALTRLEPQTHRPYVPLTQAALRSAYAVSPHFAQLQPHIWPQPGAPDWVRPGCEWMGICDEIAGGWTGWAIRSAMARIGAYDNALAARSFYRAVASEIEQACAAGTVPCTDNRSGNYAAPPLRARDLPRIATSAVKLSIWLVALKDLAPQLASLDTSGADAALTARYARITRDQGGPPASLRGERAARHARSYVFVQIALGALAAFALVTWLVPGLRHRLPVLGHGAFPAVGPVALCLAAYVAGRIGLIAYLDAMSFHAQLRYLLVVAPALLTLMVLLLPTWRPSRA